MAIKSDYISGTLTITQGSTTFTGTGTGWRSAEFKEGDTLIDITGATEYMGVIEAITGEASGTLTKAWEGPSLVNVPYRMRYQPDGARSTAQARNLIEILGNGNITAFALLNGAANLLPMFTGPGAMTLVTRQALVSGAAYDVQVATLADRAAYDGQDQGYAVLVSNVGDGRAAIYSKNSATSGDWSDPAYITGAVGPVVQIEAGTTTTLEMGQPATVVVRPITDGYALDFGIPRGPQGDDGADGADGAVGATGPRGEGLSIDATGTLSDRDNYDNELDGFTFVDTENGNLYFKDGDTPGVWSDPIPFGKGEKGDPGDSGAVIVTTDGVGNGTAGPYTLTEAPISTSATWASISGVTQYDFTISGNQITFGIIVEAGIPWQVKSSGVLSVVAPADGSVGASKINTGEAAGIRTAINAAAKPATATAGNLAVFDANREVQDTGISKSTTAQAQAGTNDTNYMTPLKTAQAILALSPPTDVSGLYSSVSALALSLADLQGSRLLMNGGVADPFDDESGIQIPTGSGIDANTSVVLHFDGANNSTTTVDSSLSPKTITVGGDAKLSTLRAKFGPSSAEFGTTSTSKFTISSDPSLAFGTEAFTVDAWVNFKAAPSASQQYKILGATLSANQINFEIYANQISVNVPGTQIILSSGLTWNVNQWYHVALVRNGTAWTVYRDGAQIATATNTQNLVVGAYSVGDGLNGFLDEFRISRVARWTSSFTPPTEAYAVPIGGSQNQVYDTALDLYRPTAGSEQTVTQTAPNTNGNIASASTEITTYPAWKAFDKSNVNENNNWITAANNPTGWLQYQFASSKTIGTYTIQYAPNSAAVGVDGNTRAPRDWTLQGSNTGAFSGEQATLDTRTAQTGWGYAETRTYQISSPQSFLYYRLVISANNGSTGYVHLGEVGFQSVPQNMTLISIPYPSTSTPTQGRLVVQLDTPLTLVSGDFDGAISRDGGTTWINTPLTLTGTVGNIKTYESLSLVDFTGPTGSSLLFRVRTLTNKNIPVSGVVMQWK